MSVADQILYNTLICDAEERKRGTKHLVCVAHSNTRTFAFVHPLTAEMGERGGRGVAGEGWGSSHYLGCAALKSTGIAFITEPKWNSGGWLPMWRKEEKSWISLRWETEWREEEKEGGLSGCTSPTRLQTSVWGGWVFMRLWHGKGGCYSPIFFSNKAPRGGIWIIMTVELLLIKIKQIPRSLFSSFFISLTLSLFFLNF